VGNQQLPTLPSSAPLFDISLNSQYFFKDTEEVESQFVLNYLLPELGYSPSTWHKQVRLISRRLDFLFLLSPEIPFVLPWDEPLELIILVKSPQDKLGPYQAELYQWMINHKAWYGILTNGQQLQLYRQTVSRIVPVFQCVGTEIESRVGELRQWLRKES